MSRVISLGAKTRSGGPQKPAPYFAAALVTLFEGWLGDALPGLEHSFAFEALVFIGRHSH